MRSFILIILSLIFLGSTVALAECLAPVASSGGREWFADDFLYKYCNGDEWISFECHPGDVTAGLLSHWRFDENAGTTAIDTAGDAMHHL